MIATARLSVFIIILCLAALHLNAQLALGEFLGSALSDHEVKTFSDQVSYLDTKPYRLSPLREVQLRTQNRELLPTQQEFGIRLSPANPFELRSQNRYFKEFNKALSFEREFALKEALLVRYLTAIEYIYFSDLLKLTEEGISSLDEQLEILQKQSGSRYFDAEDFVDLTMDQLDYTVDMEETRFELANQIHHISRTYPQAFQKSIDWSNSNVISPQRIRAVVDSLELLSIKTSWVAYQEQRVKVAQSEYSLEKNNFNLGFIQGSYDNRRVNQDRNPISISAGLSLPITNPNKGDMAKRKLDEIEAKYDVEEEVYEAETDRKILSDKVRGLIDRLEHLENKLKDLKQSNVPMTLSTIRGGDPVVLIQFTQNLEKLNELSLKVKRELFISYVEYLAFTDHLQKEPLLNFFSSSLAPVPSR
jgi:hypothetical protein